MNSAPSTLAVAYTPGLGPSRKLADLAATLGLPFVGQADPRHHLAHQVLLLQSPAGLVLQQTGKGAPGPIITDFVHGKADFRRRQGGGKGQLIAKAAGIGKRRTPLDIVDATAGLGQDAFVLASLGARVTLLERSPLVAAVLSDGLDRLSVEPELSALRERMTLVIADAREWLAGRTGPVADIIHLDPMFPHRDKSARVKKEMTVFQFLLGSDGDSAELLREALTKARFRVAVKRPRKAPPIPGPAPDLQLEGKTTRYDVYTLAAIVDP